MLHIALFPWDEGPLFAVCLHFSHLLSSRPGTLHVNTRTREKTEQINTTSWLSYATAEEMQQPEPHQGIMRGTPRRYLLRDAEVTLRQSSATATHPAKTTTQETDPA